MDELVVAGEILGGLLLLAALCVGYLIFRRTRIARGGAMVLMSVRRSGDWRAGMARVGTSHVGWFPLFGVRLRPALDWERGRLELGAPQDAPHRATGMTDPVLVPFVQGDDLIDVTLSRADYTAVRSWSESHPPGLNANTVA